VFDTTTIILLAVAVLIFLKLRVLVQRSGRERPPPYIGIIMGVIAAALILVFDFLCDYFGFPRSLHEPYGVVVVTAIGASAAFIASFISRRIVEWKTGPPAESVDS